MAETSPYSTTSQELNQEHTPNYYAIIPAHVRYCKDLEPCARLLYGEITALANKHGYCYASNEYFANLYDVDIRTVKYWVESLIKHEFIFVETEKKGMRWDRKIFISREVKELFAKGKKDHHRGENNFPIEGKKMPPKQEHSNNTTSINKDNVCETQVIAKTLPSSSKYSSYCLDLPKKFKLDEDQTETFHWLKSQNIDSDDKTLCWWAKEHSRDYLENLILQARKMKAKSIGAYVAGLIKKGVRILVDEIERNRQWFTQAIKDFNATAKINQKYAILENGTELDFNVPHADFIHHAGLKLGIL